MSKVNNFLEILNIRTTSEQRDWIIICDEILSAIKAETNFALEKYIQTHLTISQSASLEELIKTVHQDHQAEALQKLRDSLTNLTAVNMTLAFEPNSNFLDRIIGIVREKTSNQAVIHLSVAPNIIGGFVLDFNGKFYDASLANTLRNMSKEKNYAGI